MFKDLLKYFRSTPPLEPADLSVLKVDLHSHLLPGIDDGAKTLGDSIALITRLESLGFEKLITTPHIMKGAYDNSASIIKEKLALVQDELERQQSPIVLEAAAEYYLDESFEQLVKSGGEMLSFGNKMVLFELSLAYEPPNLDTVLFDMNIAGWKPVMAHPERYPYFHEKDLLKYKQIKEAGVLFQLNIGSLTGLYSERVKNVSERLIDEGMIDFLGSDLHNTKHYEIIAQTLHEKYLHKLLENNTLQNKYLIK